MAAGMLGLLVFGLLPGCEVGTPSDAAPVANGNFSGNYVGSSNANLVARSSGSAVTSMVISQFGNQLEGVDNNGILFKGTIGDILNATATFTLTGSSTAGAAVTINGNLRASGTTATLTGVWTEPSFYSSIYGTASISPITNSVATAAVARLTADF
jgi:hypothetical protein